MRNLGLFAANVREKKGKKEGLKKRKAAAVSIWLAATKKKEPRGIPRRRATGDKGVALRKRGCENCRLAGREGGGASSKVGKLGKKHQSGHEASAKKKQEVYGEGRVWTTGLRRTPETAAASPPTTRERPGKHM